MSFGVLFHDFFSFCQKKKFFFFSVPEIFSVSDIPCLTIRGPFLPANSAIPSTIPWFRKSSGPPGSDDWSPKALFFRRFLKVKALLQSNTHLSSCKYPLLSSFGQTGSDCLIIRGMTGNNESGPSQATAASGFQRNSLIKGCLVTFVRFFVGFFLLDW